MSQSKDMDEIPEEDKNHSNINNMFVPYVLALKLRELGFDGECFAFYFTPEIDRIGNKILHFIPMGGAMGNDFNVNSLLRCYPSYRKYMKMEHQVGYILNTNVSISVPLWQQAFDWFREKHNVKQYIYEILEGKWVFLISKKSISEYKISETYHNTYEEARLACLEKLIVYT